MINYYCLQNNWSTCFPHNVMMQAELQNAGTTGTQYPSIDGRYSLPSKRKTVTCENIQHWPVFTFSAKYINKLLFDFPKVFYIQQHRGYLPGNEDLLDAGKFHPVLRDTARQCVAISLSNRRDSTVSCGIPVSATLMIFHSVPTYRSSKVESYWLCIQSQIKYYTEIECRAFLICNYHKRFKAFIHFQVKEFLQ